MICWVLLILNWKKKEKYTQLELYIILYRLLVWLLLIINDAIKNFISIP